VLKEVERNLHESVYINSVLARRGVEEGHAWAGWGSLLLEMLQHRLICKS
jgi:hypothetical protein